MKHFIIGSVICIVALTLPYCNCNSSPAKATATSKIPMTPTKPTGETTTASPAKATATSKIPTTPTKPTGKTTTASPAKATATSKIPTTPTKPTGKPTTASSANVTTTSKIPTTTTKPTVCPDECAKCTGETVVNCVYCKTGYWMNQTVCDNCPEGCAVCESATNCTECMADYIFSANGTACEFNGTTSTPVATKTTVTPSPSHKPVNGTTSTPVATKTTVTPSPSHKQGHGSCGFSAGSFFGGMALAGGVAVIVFFGCKFYKARSMPSYHQF